MNKAWLTLGAALLALAAGTLLYLRTSPAPRNAARQGRQEMARQLYGQAQRAFGAMSSTPVSAIVSPEQVASMLNRAYLQAPIPDGGGTRDALVSHVAEFIYHRFVRNDPAGYRRWRDENGYTLVPWADLDSYWRLGEDYEFNIGPIPGDLTSAAAFDGFWLCDAKAPRSTVGMPVAIIDEARGLVICAGRYSRINATTPHLQGDPAAGGLSADLWGGMGGGGFSRWYSSRRRPASMSQTAIMRTTEPVVYADVGFVLVFADGARLPFSVRCCWDAEHELWSIESLADLNSRPGQTGPKVF